MPLWPPEGPSEGRYATRWAPGWLHIRMPPILPLIMHVMSTCGRIRSFPTAGLRGSAAFAAAAGCITGHLAACYNILWACGLSETLSRAQDLHIGCLPIRSRILPEKGSCRPFRRRISCFFPLCALQPRVDVPGLSGLTAALEEPPGGLDRFGGALLFGCIESC